MHNPAVPLPTSERAQPGTWAVLARIALTLAGIQATRAAITVLLWAWLRPEPSSPLWYWIDLVAFTAVGLALLAIFRPSPAMLGLAWQGTSRLARGITIGSGALTLLLVLSSAAFGPGLLLENARNALMFPIFEEPLFRGWVWSRLETTMKPLNGKYTGLLTWLVSSALFSLWHLGYFDVYLLVAFARNPTLNVPFFVLMKLSVTLVIGLMVGFLRWRTRRAFGSLVLHALINVFGK